MFECKHKYGKVEDGFQYCEKCGKAIPAPEKICSHNWTEVAKFGFGPAWADYTSHFDYIMKCSHCGDMKKISTSDL